MSMPPEPPERLAEILLEILALSDSKGKSRSESLSGGHQDELSEPQDVRELLGRSDEEGNNRKEP